MNKGREAILKKILAQPDVTQKVSPKNVLRFVDNMQPETQEMRDYLMAMFSAETLSESEAISKAWYDKMTPKEQELFTEQYIRCLNNKLTKPEKVATKSTVKLFAHSI